MHKERADLPPIKGVSVQPFYRTILTEDDKDYDLKVAKIVEDAKKKKKKKRPLRKVCSCGWQFVYLGSGQTPYSKYVCNCYMTR